MKNNQRSNIVILNRWSSDYAKYENYVDHRANNVFYICNKESTNGASRLASGIRVVSSTGNLEEVRAAVRIISEEFGSLSRIVALYEDDQLIAAQIREDYQCPGPTVKHVLPFRDKLVMLKTANSLGVNVPPFVEALHPRDVEEFGEKFGYPIILKPRLESSAAGISKIGSRSEIEAAFSYAQSHNKESLIAQVFVQAPIIHIDGVFSDGEIVFCKASDYINNCLTFRGQSSTLGSVEKTSPDSQLEALERFAQLALNSLSVDDSTFVFHMEVFALNIATSQYALLEVGARVGGAMIPFVWREVHGIDLMQVAWDASVGDPNAKRKFLLQLNERNCANEVAGWLLIQNPLQPPCKVTYIKSMLNETYGPYAELLPEVGFEIPLAETFFEHIAARFRFRGESSEQVKLKIQETAGNFVISASAAG